jgi:phosphate transport system substrate-binding protein
LLILGLSLIATASQGEPLRIGGTGSGSALMERLAQEYKRLDPAAEVRVIMPPLGSGGGLRALSAGEIDIAVVGRALKPEEAALPGLGRGFEYAKTPFVIATNSPKVSELSLGQLAQIYAGHVVRWPDGSPIRLILRSKSESDTALMRGFSAELSASIDASYERKGMTIADNDVDAVDLLVKTPNALGPTTLGLLRIDGRPLTALRIDGVEPTVKAMSSGAYRWAKSIHVVTASALTPQAQKFLTFLHSDRARRLLAGIDQLPVSTWTPAANDR